MRVLIDAAGGPCWVGVVPCWVGVVPCWAGGSWQGFTGKNMPCGCVVGAAVVGLVLGNQ
jgi:hypothetical protein